MTKQRNQGLKKAIEENKQARLFNIVNGDWKRDITASFMPKILSRHQDINIFWASSDIMAYGIIDGLDNAGISLSKRPLIGSIDWSPDSIHLIRQGKLNVSLGGHFMEGGWAIQLYHAYVANKDFAQQLGTKITTMLSPLLQKNVDKLGNFLENPRWQTSVLLQLQEDIQTNKIHQFSPENEIYQHQYVIYKDMNIK